MPYYEEYYEAEPAETTLVNSGVPSTSPLARDSTYMVGFRGRPSPKARLARELLDINVDPYAYFLDSVSESRYKSLLSERNLPAQGSPDRGHAWRMSKYSLNGSWLQPTYVSKSFGSAEIRIPMVNPVWTPSVSNLGSTGDLPLHARTNPSTGLATFAQQAYSRSAPTAKVFDAAQFLGELREGLPHLGLETLKSSSHMFRGLGSDYLNVQFGWKPFLNDLINAAKALSGATSVLAGVGQRVHRRYGIPTTYTAQEKQFSNKSLTTWLGFTGYRSLYAGNDLPLSPIGNAVAPDPASGYWLRTSETTRWFEGEFTNFMPLGFDPSDYFQRLKVLVNFEITPAVLWELAPWSWLVDWFLRIQDSITANLNAANDLLVMHYGYAMEHQIFRDLISLDLSAVPRSKANGATSYAYWLNLPATASWVATSEFKTRLRANPYGFRTGGTASLNGGQLAILGALGLTKLK